MKPNIKTRKESKTITALGVFSLVGYGVLAAVLVQSRQVKWREMPAKQAMVQA